MFPQQQHQARATRRASLVLVSALLLSLLLRHNVSSGAEPLALLQLSADPYTNPSSQHQTQVEPDTFAYGSTIVAAFQSGRFPGIGASNIGWATSQDGGATWTSGFLPGLTRYDGDGQYDHATDPSVAYDARRNVWLISSLVLTDTPLLLNQRTAILVSRSLNGGSAWEIPALVVTGDDLDKNWTVCDNTLTSPYFGRCYTVWNNGSLSASDDGGATWGAPTSAPFSGFGNQPVVQPDGAIIMTIGNGFAILAARSTDGGATWSSVVSVAPVSRRRVAGNLRVLLAPSAEVDAAGKMYVAWQDCSFRSACAANDIVISSSADGMTWSPPLRVPIADVGSFADHFIPGLGVDSTTSGTGTRLGLTFYYYPSAECIVANCLLNVGFIASTDGGSTWSAPIQLAGPMCLSWLPGTSQGLMVGDYISTSFVNGVAYPVFAVAHAPNAGVFDQAMYTVQGGLQPTSLPTATLTMTSELNPCPATFLPAIFDDSNISSLPVQ
jgi:hypothetical protein